jgi:hypothetical protein
MFTRSEESAMFPTWFRTLCLAYLGQVDLGMVFLKDDWKFVRCPGHQFFEREE